MIRLSNTLTRAVEEFKPLDVNHVKMYVCGPTVYDRPHLGNARSEVVYDLLARLLRQDFKKLTYARNITDVDDKINVASIARKIPIAQLTQEVTKQFHDDMKALGCLSPDIEPKATAHISQMITMIEALIASGHAYVEQGHALFSVKSDPNYGKLSRRSQKDMIAGARVEVAPYKKDPGDFVLWKPAFAPSELQRGRPADDPSSVFDSPWGAGRPGWHIECSAMASAHLGIDFDIHGGGSDLMFPHHENEIAQSTCAHAGSQYARTWVHNGFLTVNGEKMSKSLGNFITVRDLLDKGVKGEVIRLALLSTRYNEPLDWSDKLISDAQKSLDKFQRAAQGAKSGAIDDEVLEALRDNLNTPRAAARLHALDGVALKASAQFLGFLQVPYEQWFKGDDVSDTLWIDVQVAARNDAKKARDFAKADAIRQALKQKGIALEDTPQGTVWRRAP